MEKLKDIYENMMNGKYRTDMIELCGTDIEIYGATWVVSKLTDEGLEHYKEILNLPVTNVKEEDNEVFVDLKVSTEEMANKVEKFLNDTAGYIDDKEFDKYFDTSVEPKIAESYNEMKERQAKEFNEFPIEFAFDDKQFKKAMEELGLNENDTDKITGIGAGGFIRNSDLESYKDMNKRHKEELKQAIENDKTGEGFIKGMFESELANHEYGYTYDLTDTLVALGLSEKDINSNKNLQNGLNLALSKYKEHEDVEEDDEEEDERFNF